MQEATTGDGVATEWTFGSNLAQPLLCLTTLLSFLQHRQVIQAGKAGSCLLFLHLSPSLPPSGANFEDRVLEVFVLATFPYNPHKGDRFCLAAKGYYSRKHWGRGTSGQWCYHRSRETSYPLFLFFATFLTKIWNKQHDKIFLKEFSAIIQKPQSVCYSWKRNGRI